MSRPMIFLFLLAIASVVLAEDATDLPKPDLSQPKLQNPDVNATDMPEAPKLDKNLPNLSGNRSLLNPCVCEITNQTIEWLDIFKNLNRETKGYYNPNYGYEPYWVGGEWAITGEGGILIHKSSVPLVCGDECEPRFVPILEICARDVSNRQYISACSEVGMLLGLCHGVDLDDYTNAFTTFPTYCIFLDAQCRGAMGNKFWTFVHLGKCETTQSIIHKPVDQGWYMVSRKDMYFSKLIWQFKNMTLEPPM